MTFILSSKQFLFERNSTELFGLKTQLKIKVALISMATYYINILSIDKVILHRSFSFFVF